MVQEIKPFQMIEPYGERQPGDFGIYPVPADTPEDGDPKASVAPAEAISETDLATTPSAPSVTVPPPAGPTPPALK